MAPSMFTKERDVEKGSQSTISAPVSMHNKRTLASANPLGLFAFATSLFMLALLDLHPRGVVSSNIVVGNMIFFGGISQVIAGIIDFCAGNAFGATVFSAYGAFNLAYSTIFIPGSGILAAYTDKATGELSPEFNQAVALFVWGWFIITALFTIGAIRSNLILLCTLSSADITLILIATGMMTGNETILKASSGFGIITAAFAYYAGAAYLYVDGVTPFTLPLFPLSEEQ
ncbi:GPR1/FUN34/yaaH family-domain-containing protein [Xylariomycetidae sp. FL0641]|nr:GPR1/FUN34/yaaH family-domain-containing protein [Xylariomycetidae sp. FL0641]